MYHNRKECLPPGCAENHYAFACPAHAHLPLPGETRDDALNALKQGLLSAASFSTADLEALYGAESAAAYAEEDEYEQDQVASPSSSPRRRSVKATSSDRTKTLAANVEALIEDEEAAADKVLGDEARVEFSQMMTKLNKSTPVASTISSISKTIKGLFVPPNRPPAHDYDDYRHFCLRSSLILDIKPNAFTSSSSSSITSSSSSSSSSASSDRGVRSSEALVGKQGNRPPPFRFIHRNQYLIKVKPEYPESEACDCKRGTCGDECVNRILRVECYGGHKAAAELLQAAAAAQAALSASTNSDVPSSEVLPTSSSSSSSSSSSAYPRDRHGTNCSIGIHCGNRALQQRVSPPLTIAVTEGKGWGAIASADIPAGQFIVEYVGEIIDEEEQDKRLEEAKVRGEAHYYMMEIDANQIIDARVKSNLARFLNHSCEPNAELQRWSVEGFTRIGIFATKDIKKGEEVAYDYQFFSSEETLCRCGAEKCRGYLGANVAADKLREQEEKEEEERAAVKRKAAAEAKKKAAAKRKSSLGSGGGGGSSVGGRKKKSLVGQEEDEQESGCQVCGLTEAEGVLVICDGCNSDHHLECLDPPLKEAPEGDFFCPKCIVSGRVIASSTSAAAAATMSNVSSSDSTTRTTMSSVS
jgi:hypothetical protein